MVRDAKLIDRFGEQPVLEFVKSNVLNWVDGHLWYDERVPGWALVPVLIAAGAGSVAVLFVGGPGADQLPSPTLLPMVVASAAIAVAILAKWRLQREAKSVPLASAASLWTAVTWLAVLPSPAGSVWPPFALVFLSPLLAPAVGRAWAMLAWHHRLELTMRETRAVLQSLLDGHPRDGVYLMRVDAVDGDDVELMVFDGKLPRRGWAHCRLWTSVSPGRWYLARGVTKVDGRGKKKRQDLHAAEVVRIAGAKTIEFLGIVDPRTERDRESFVPEMVFWVISLAGLLVIFAAGAWLLASFTS